MQDGIRKSGIAVIGNVPWGTHFCQFYQTKKDLIDSLVPYFQAGLENNEFCMWVTADNLTVAEARKALAKDVKGFSTYLNKGQIEILPYDEWYLQSGSFDKQRVLDGWMEKLNQALKKGYAGLRLTGNTFWLEKKDWHSFTDYEAAVNNVIGKYKMIALCTYCLDKCSATEIIDVISNHEFALIKQDGKLEIIENSRYMATKEELAESEKRFRLALKNAPITVATQDSDLNFLWAYNQRTMQPEAVLGKTDFDVFPKKDAEKLVALKRKVIETSQAINEKMWITSNGKRVYLDLFLEPATDETGKITGIEIATIDLTEQKLIEDALKESEERFRTISETSPNIIAVSRISDGTLLYINRAYSEAFGYKLSELIGHQALNIYCDPADRTTLINRLNERKFLQNYEVRVKKADGTPFWVSVSISPITFSGELAIMSVSIDITERKRIETDIIRLNRELQAIRECDQIIVHSTDETALLTDVCRILCTTAGYLLAWIGSVEHDKAKSIRPLIWHGDGDYLTSANITWADTERGCGPTGSAARTGKTNICQDFATEPAVAPWREAAVSRGYRSSIAIPLKENDNIVFAVLTLYSSEPNSFNPAEIQLLEELAHDISFGIISLRERTRRRQAELELTHLASFPELNPNPIIEIDENNRIKYLNSAAKAIFPGLLTEGIQHPFLAGWEAFAQTLKTTKLNQAITREILFNRYWYEQNALYLPEIRSYRIYCRDITERKQTLDTIRESEERNRLILETTMDGVWTNDLSGRFLYVNDAYCEMIGYQRHELLNMSIQNIEAKEKQDETKEHINIIVRQGGDQFETRHIRKDGKIIDVEISAKYSNMQGGQLVVFARNITERKKVETELKESEERFYNAFHNSPVALSISRISDGNFIDVNDSFLHLFGYRREELVGQRAIEINIYDNPKDRNEIVRLLQQKGKVVNYEVTARTKNGNEIKALTSAEKIEINGQEHIIWTTIDISEREQAEYLLRETSNYLNNLLDYANAPIIVWDPHFRISRFNPAFERLTGYRSQDVIGLGLDILFPENKKTESLHQISRTLSGERWETVEITIQRTDGMVRTVLWNSANVYDTDGKKIIATIAQGQDITERKQAEEEVEKLNGELKSRATELEASNKELEAFAYSVSHDLRAPLRSMEGFSQALLEDCYDTLNDECKDYLKRIQSSAELMAQLIDDLLQLSRLTRTEMVFSKVKLSELAQAVAAKLKNDEPKRKAEFVITPGLIAHGDENLLRIALVNLLGNAWKFTGKLPEARIEFGITERDGKKVYFVRDNGAGFDMTYVDKLFKPFQRLHSSLEFPGTGIGLASVQRIINRHGGKVWAEGKAGQGATFYFTLE